MKPFPDSEEEGHDHQEAHQKYETMQCFAVSQPKSIKEEGEGRAEPRGSSASLCVHSRAPSFTLNLKFVAAKEKFSVLFTYLTFSGDKLGCRAFKTALPSRAPCVDGSVPHVPRPVRGPVAVAASGC